MANSIAESILSGVQLGRENKRQRTIAEYIQPALSGDEGALGQLFKVDSNTGMQAQRAAAQKSTADKAAQVQELQQAAALWKSAPPELRAPIYGRIRDLTASLGLAPADKLPLVLDSPELEQNFGRFIDSLAGNQAAEPPSSIRELQMLRDNPELAALDMQRRTAGFDRPQLIQTDQGYAWATPKGATPLNYGSAPAQQPARADGGSTLDRIQQALAKLNVPGVTMTSGYRSPEHNAKVGGKPNSQHMHGTAGDFVVPDDMKDSFIERARAAGLTPIDEGDHIHVQAANGSRVMPAPKAQGTSDIERRVAIAQSMGASEEDIRRMVVGAPANKPTAAGAASAKVPQLNAVDRGIERIDAALKGLEGNKIAGTGPIDRFVTGYSDQGRELEAAVNSIQNQLLALTRVPGMGSQSDLEARIAAMQYPSLDMPEATNRRTLQNLRLFIQDLRKQVEGASPQGPTSTPPSDIDSLLEKYSNGNP